ncbi:MAG: metal-dependent hydrolase [Candidatus Bathyarchaeota archaeon]|nr:metal-dependent hydrolase [Candidatus Bathyarchaeota archaeon]MDH5532727.1 metal-dependent hydrolase [Candidatus Bathyarchaeota archaeon]MDH5712984.1 metal-dependent hydrolase [Candidatus Bathyarchaeota archaeon]
MGRIRWLGHSAFEIQLMNKTVLIDPWLDGNPKAPLRASDITKADIVCVTHDHSDHLGDALDICKRTGATFVGVHELSVYAQEKGVEETVGINIGGTVDVKGTGISMVRAFHSCTRGAPAGFVLKGEGKTIYHAGDTGLFGDMRLIGEIHRPDVALIPIGGYYTMGDREAARAVKLVNPSVVIPMHYQTFPVLASSAKSFTRIVRETLPEVKVVVLEPGEAYQL